MAKRMDLTGNVYGRLTVTKMGPVKNRLGKHYVICACTPENEFLVTGAHLKNGHTRSCGCLNTDLRRERWKGQTHSRSPRDPKETSWKRKYSTYRHCAENRDIEFQLTLPEFKIICTNSCYYCGIAPNSTFNSYLKQNGEMIKGCLKDGNNREYVDTGTIICHGIDRLDNNKGYTSQNSKSCCKQCNYFKNTLTVDAFLTHVKIIYDYQLSIANNIQDTK